MNRCQFGPDERGERYCHVHCSFQRRPYDSNLCPRAVELLAGGVGDRVIRIVQAVRTCWGCPSQWDALTDDGDYLYLRFRYGIGTADVYPSGRGERVGTAVRVAEFDAAADGLDGVIDLADFCRRARLVLDAIEEEL